MSKLAAIVVVALTAPAYADRVVALVPLSTLGSEDKSAATQQLTATLERALAALPNAKVVGAARVAAAIDKAKKPQLNACEGEASCVAEVGKLVGASVVVTGEVGGLGDSKVVYLDATDVATAKELRATTLAVGDKEGATAADAAVVRLLDPDRYKGTVHFAIDVVGATVFVNGSRATLPASGDLALPVGTQAIRVTHPEYHDFVRFVEVPYGKITELPVGLQQYPIVQQNVKGLPTSRDHIDYVDPPRWREWYVIGPAAIVLTVATIIIRGSMNGVCKPTATSCKMISVPQ